MKILEIEQMLKDYFESVFAGGDFMVWLREESTNPLSMSFNTEAKELIGYYDSCKYMLFISDDEG